VKDIFKWYRENQNIVEAIVDLGMEFVPGAKFILGGIKLALAKLRDEKELKELPEGEREEYKTIIESLEPLVEKTKTLIFVGESATISELKTEILSKRELREEIEKVLHEFTTTWVKRVSNSSEVSESKSENPEFTGEKRVELSSSVLIDGRYFLGAGSGRGSRRSVEGRGQNSRGSSSFETIGIPDRTG